MRKRRVGSWTAAAAALLAAASARGEDRPGALEATVGLGIDQGFGSVGDGIPRLQDTGSAGAAMEVGIGWRIEPHFTVGAYGSGSAHGPAHAASSSARAYAAAAGFTVSYHGRPYRRLDPWIGVGFGWRRTWVEGGQGTDVLAGMDLARIQTGVDYALSDRMSVSPVLGLSVTQFVSHKPEAEGSYRDVTDARTVLFVFGGVLGRFEVLASQRSAR